MKKIDPILLFPVAINYSDKTMAWVGQDTLAPHVFSHFWRPITKAEIKFGEPISGGDYLTLKTKTQQAINEMLGEEQNSFSLG